MSRAAALLLSLFAGVVIGAVGIGHPRASANAPAAYAIIEIGDVADQRTLEASLAQTRNAGEAFGGKTVITSARITGRDFVPPRGFVLMSFASVEDAEAWSASSAQAQADHARDAAAKARSFLAEEARD